MNELAQTYVDPVSTRPFYRYLGLEAEPNAGEGVSCLRLRSRPELGNSHGGVHGGAIMSLLDAAMGVAARTLLDESQGVTTASLSVNFVTAGKGDLVARGRVIRRGKSIASTEAFAEDSEGRVVAHAIGTMRIVSRLSGDTGAASRS